MDFSKLAKTEEGEYRPNEPFTLHVLAIDGSPQLNDDGSEMTLDLLGYDSDVLVRHRNAVGNRYIQRGSKAVITKESVDADTLASLVKATTGWNVSLDGQKVPFTPENAKDFYAEPLLLHIREQADEALNKRANFLKASAKS